jgi:hypothetical protein
MSSPGTPPLADTTDMIGLHRVFRDAFGGSVGHIDRADPNDTERVDLVGSYFDNVLRLLHVHHIGEDELVTPRLVQRGSADEVREVERVAAQHADVVDAIETAEEAIATWRAAPTTDSAAVASSAVSALAEPLVAHLDDEERTVLPIAGRYITAPEWGELPAHGMQAFTGDKIWLVMGLIQEQMTPAQVTQMETHMPPPVADWWAAQGKQMYLEYVARLRAV